MLAEQRCCLDASGRVDRGSELRQYVFRTALPSIHLANLRSLPNKLNKLLLLSQTNRIFQTLLLCVSWKPGWMTQYRTAHYICRTSSWSEQESTGNQCRINGEIAWWRHVLLHQSLCTDVTVLKKMCCSDLETLFINCKPFYSRLKICSFIVSVYISPQSHVSSVLQKLVDQITEQKYPDSVLIISGDFNKANISRELPKYRQHVTCPTRDSNILDHFYTTIKDAFHSVPQGALGLSDHGSSYTDLQTETKIC